MTRAKFFAAIAAVFLSIGKVFGQTRLDANQIRVDLVGTIPIRKVFAVVITSATQIITLPESPRTGWPVEVFRNGQLLSTLLTPDGPSDYTTSALNGYAVSRLVVGDVVQIFYHF